MSRFRLFPAMWLLPLLLLAADALPQTTRRPLLIADGAGQPVQLEQLHVTVETAAGFATTTLDMRFRNPNARMLEGNLQLPLADGQQVAGFALDVDGTMRDAVPVDKQTGREVFEAIERRGVDPGLLQQTAGNQFELRVYPVPAHGVRQVRVVLMQPLGIRDGQHLLPLPWRVIEQAQSVVLQVAGTVDRPQLPASVGPVAFRRQGTVWKHVWARGIGSVTGHPELRWAQQATDSTPAVWVQRDRGQAHAVASIPLSGRTAQRALPTTVGLVWDASASGRHRRHDLELAVLDRVLRDAGDVTIQLTVLRDVPEVARTFHIRGGDWTALRQQLQALVYDGASNPGGWTPDPAIAYYLHVGDGLFNAGHRRWPAMARGQRLDVLHASRQADHARLLALVQRQGGQVIAVGDAADVARAAAALGSDAPRITGLQMQGGEDPVMASAWPDAGRVHVAARITGPKPVLSVYWRDADGDHVKQVPLAAADAMEGRLAGRLWANWASAALQDDPVTHREQLRRIGQRYGIVNATTSLIVLENVEDYVENDILPPDELLAQYNSLLDERHVAVREQREAGVERAAERWAERVQWWNTRWPKTRPAAPKIGREEEGMDGAMAASAPMPPPPPAPAPMAAPIAERARADTAAAAADSQTLERIMVTGSALAVEEAAASADENVPAASIRLQPWQSDSPAARQLRAAKSADTYATYLQLRDANADSPAFYLDAADVLFERGQRDLALRVLSNLAELQIENRHLLRVLAYRLLQAEAPALALPYLQRVLDLAEDEPQSHRDLGLALALNDQPQPAAEQLYEVVVRDWDGRFGGVDMIALAELNALLARERSRIDSAVFDKRLLRNLPVGLRAVLSWDADNSDMDLWVTDPDGEKTFYGSPRSHQGGRLSEDFTGGYGPEEFVLRDPKPGRYVVEANYFGDRQQVVTGDTTLQLWLSTGFGTPRQVDRRITLRLRGAKETVLVGEFTVP